MTEAIQRMALETASRKRKRVLRPRRTKGTREKTRNCRTT